MTFQNTKKDVEVLMICVIDYDAGNLESVCKALKYIGQDVLVTRDENEIMRAQRLILPGVGAFGDAMGNLSSLGLDRTIREYVGTGRPFLGICLGLQLLFDSSEESPGVEGLGLLRGCVKRFPNDMGLKIPHIGWNSLEIAPSSRLFKGIDDGSYFYFVHSYYLQAEDEADVAGVTEYGIRFHAAAEHGNIFATQFHPEKSGEIGLAVLENFAKL